jgi:hypothetical protein
MLTDYLRRRTRKTFKPHSWKGSEGNGDVVRDFFSVFSDVGTVKMQIGAVHYNNRIHEDDWGFRSNHMGKAGQRIGQSPFLSTNGEEV